MKQLLSGANPLLWTLIPLLWTVLSLPSCEKDLSITEFSEFYEQYQPQLKIEAFLNSDNPLKSTIVIDRSLRVDDTTVFNGRDDDGDWQGYYDANSNGQWDPGEDLRDDLGEDGIEGDPNGFPPPDTGEGNGQPDPGEPNVDEADEIARILADSTSEVYITDMATGDRIDFHWMSIADSFQFNFNTDETDLLPDSFVTQYYGAYKPVEDFSVFLDRDYELTVISPEYDLTVKGSTRPVDRVRVLNMDFSMPAGDTLEYIYGEENYLFWLSSLDATTYYYNIYLPTLEGDKYLTSNPSFPLESLNTAWPDSALGFTFFPPLMSPNLYAFDIWALNPDMGRYFFSTQAIDNPAVSNLRDQNGQPVMGIFGSYSEVRKYILMKDQPAEAAAP